MSSKEFETTHRGNSIIFDSDFRAGALIYSFITVILFSYSLVNCIVFNRLMTKSSELLPAGSSLGLFITSIIITIFAFFFMIYSIYKLLVVKEMRDKITNSIINFASKESGFIRKKREEVDPNKIGADFPLVKPGDEKVSQNLITEDQPLLSEEDYFVSGKQKPVDF